MANEFQHATVGVQLTQAEYESIIGHQFASQAMGDMLYASSATQLSRVPIGAANAVLRVIGGIPGWTTTPSLAGLTMTGDIELAANKLQNSGASDIYLAFITNGFEIRRKSSGVFFMDFAGGDLTLTTTGALQTQNADAADLRFKARDAGVGLIIVGKLQGAADPYFQLDHCRLTPITTVSLPATPVEGMVYMDTTVKKLKFYNGTAWETVTSA